MLTDTKLRNLKPRDKLYKVNDREGLYVGVASENGIYGHSRFCNTDFDDKLACLNLRFTGSSTGRWAVSIINISIRKTR